MSRFTPQHHDETGSLLIGLLGVLVVTGLCTVLVATVVVGQRQTRFDQGYEQSLQVAEVGLERLARLVVDRAAADGQTYTETVDGGTYTARAETTATGWVLSADGTAANGVTRTVSATMDRPVFHPIAFFADHMFQASGTSSFCVEGAGCSDVEPPLSLDGLAGSNDRVHFNGVPSMAFGKLQLADWAANDDAEARCTFHGGARVDCAVEERVQHVSDRLEIMSPERTAYVEALTSACTPLPSSTRLGPGTYCTTTLDVGPLTLDGSGDVQIVVTGTGTVALGRTGTPDKRTVNDTGDATRLQIFAPYAEVVSLVSNSTLKAMVYAPNALCAGQGGVTFTGALLCDEIDTGGNADYYAPDDIGRLRYGYPRLRDWREQ